MRATTVMDIGPEAAAGGSEVCKWLVTCWGEACTDYLLTPARTIKGCGGTKRMAKIRGPEKGRGCGATGGPTGARACKDVE